MTARKPWRLSSTNLTLDDLSERLHDLSHEAASGPTSAGPYVARLCLSRLAGRHGLHWMTRTKHDYNGPVLALSSAFLFGASSPIAKLLLGITDPLLLAGLLYLEHILPAPVSGISRAVNFKTALKNPSQPWRSGAKAFEKVTYN